MCEKAADLRKQLAELSLEWESYFGVAPSLTSAISEIDAALLVGIKEDSHCADGKLRTAVSKDVDFVCNGIRYQVTANRPSGKKGSPVTFVSQKTERKRPFGWDRLIWILYDRFYVLQEAWEFTGEEFGAFVEDYTWDMDPRPWRPYDPVVEAYKKDIDLTLIRENLKLTVTERFQNAMALARFADELRRAGTEARKRK